MAPEAKKSFNCPVCFKQMAYSQKAVHMRIHTGVKPFKCQFCEKSFVQKIQCVVHERIHTGEMPFTCTHCSKGFKQSANLMVHIERYHSEEGRTLNCQECHKAFQTTKSLKRHEKIHHRYREKCLANAEASSSRPNLHFGKCDTNGGSSAEGGDAAEFAHLPEPTTRKPGDAELSEKVKFEMFGQKFYVTPHPTKRWEITINEGDE